MIRVSAKALLLWERMRLIVASGLIFAVLGGLPAAPFSRAATDLTESEALFPSIAFYVLLGAIYARSYPFFAGSAPRRMLCSLATCFLAWIGLTFVALSLLFSGLFNFTTGHGAYAALVGVLLVVVALRIFLGPMRLARRSDVTG